MMDHAEDPSCNNYTSDEAGGPHSAVCAFVVSEVNKGLFFLSFREALLGGTL